MGWMTGGGVQIESWGMSVTSLRKTSVCLPPFKEPQAGAGDMAELTECLPSMHEALGSVPATT